MTISKKQTSKSRYFVLTRRTLLIAALLLLCACGGVVILDDSSERVSNTFKNLSPRLISGETPKKIIHSMLGPPEFTNKELRIEIYLKEEEDTLWFWAYFVPLFPTGTSSVQGHLLVQYDENEVLKNYDHFLISEPALNAAATRDYPRFGEARIDGYTYGARWRDVSRNWIRFKRETYLFAPVDIGLKQIENNSLSEKCTVYISSSGEDIKSLTLNQSDISNAFRGLMHNNSLAFLKIDRKHYFDRHNGQERFFVPFSSTAGEQSLRIKWTLENIIETKKFTCASGDKKYIHVESKAEGEQKKWSLIGFELKAFEHSISVYDTIPIKMDSTSILIYFNGETLPF